MTSKNSFGVITEYYQYSMDGEFCSGYKEYDVRVTKWWGKGHNFNKAKEVITLNNICFRQTTANGWRKYDKISKTYYNKSYTGTNFTFIPNRNANNQTNYNRVNLGSW